MSISWQLDDETAPSLLVLPPAAASLDEAHAAIELWEHYSRKVLDPAQRLTVEVMMAQGADGCWAAKTTGREMPRQNGKGDEVEVVELWGLVQRSEAILHTVHDAVLLASQAQQRMLGVLEGHADLRRLVKRKWQGTGQQMIEMRNGGVVWYRTRTGGGGRGVDDIDRLIVDEAQHATIEHLAAVAPTLLANTNPQLNAMGTAGLAGKSAWWWSVRRRALTPDPGEFGYVGHTAENVHLDARGQVVQPKVDVQDRALWRRSNPSIVAGRGQGMGFLEEQLRRLGEDAFAQEHLGVWDPEPGFGGSVIPAEAWESCLTSGDPGMDGRPIYAVDVSPDRSTASVGVAFWRSDGLPQVEIAAQGEGTGWIVPWLVERKSKRARRLVDPAGPAGSLLSSAEAAGVPLETVSAREHAQACGLFYDDVIGGRLRHLDSPALASALAGADKRPSGEAWLWSRKTSTADITPLVAVTLARWALGAKKKPQVIDMAAVLAQIDGEGA